MPNEDYLQAVLFLLWFFSFDFGYSFEILIFFLISVLASYFLQLPFQLFHCSVTVIVISLYVLAKNNSSVLLHKFFKICTHEHLACANCEVT